MEQKTPYEEPAIEDYGELVQITLAEGTESLEETGPAFALLDVPDEVCQ